MRHSQKNYALFALLITVGISIAAMQPPASPYKNLQVLPKNISEKTLDSLMDSYNKALKVSCEFCHEKATDFLALTPANGNVQLDYAKDNGMKQEARRMIKLTVDINKQYFNFIDSVKKPDYLLNVISCNTCHRGNPYPANE
jgi:hypothetical protein